MHESILPIAESFSEHTTLAGMLLIIDKNSTESENQIHRVSFFFSGTFYNFVNHITFYERGNIGECNPYISIPLSELLPHTSVINQSAELIQV